MKGIKELVAVSSLALLSVSALADPPANFSGWELVFEDNFDGTSLDKSKWNPTYNWGSTHNHRAYCDPANGGGSYYCNRCLLFFAKYC